MTGNGRDLQLSLPGLELPSAAGMGAAVSRRFPDPRPRASGSHGSRRERAIAAVEAATSHVETLIERVTGIDKALPDPDGDYPVRFRDALYFVRVDGDGDEPVVRVYSPVLLDVPASAELFEAINAVNASLGFCRCLLLDDRVVIEAEHLGLTLRTDDFRELTHHVASASDFFGSTLIQRFGGRRPLADLPDDEDEAPKRTGMYL